MSQTWHAVGSFLVRNQDLLMGVLIWPLITAIMNLALRKKTPEQWEAWALSKPALACGVELLRALGADPFKLLQAFHRLAQRRSGVIPTDAVRMSSLPEPLKAALLNPEFLKLLTEAAHKLQTEQQQQQQEPAAAPATSSTSSTAS